MYVAVLIGLAAFLIFSILAAITFGNADLSLKDVYSVIAYKLFHIKSLSAYAEGAVHDVVWLIRAAQSPAGSGSWNGSFRLWRSYAGDCPEPTGRSVCTWYFIRCIPWCNTGDHAWSWWISRWKLSWCSCIYWCNGHFFCSNCHCKHGRKSYFCQTDPCRNGRQCGMFCFFQFCYLYHQ